VIQPDGMTDDLGRESVAVISGFGSAHPVSVPNAPLLSSR
jgi:hypothetical protein